MHNFYPVIFNAPHECLSVPQRLFTSFCWHFSFFFISLFERAAPVGWGPICHVQMPALAVTLAVTDAFADTGVPFASSCCESQSAADPLGRAWS